MPYESSRCHQHSNISWDQQTAATKQALPLSSKASGQVEGRSTDCYRQNAGDTPQLQGEETGDTEKLRHKEQCNTEYKTNFTGTVLVLSPTPYYLELCTGSCTGKVSTRREVRNLMSCRIPFQYKLGFVVFSPRSYINTCISTAKYPDCLMDHFC